MFRIIASALKEIFCPFTSDYIGVLCKLERSRKLCVCPYFPRWELGSRDCSPRQEPLKMCLYVVQRSQEQSGSHRREPQRGVQYSLKFALIMLHPPRIVNPLQRDGECACRFYLREELPEGRSQGLFDSKYFLSENIILKAGDLRRKDCMHCMQCLVGKCNGG